MGDHTTRVDGVEILYFIINAYKNALKANDIGTASNFCLLVMAALFDLGYTDAQIRYNVNTKESTVTFKRDGRSFSGSGALTYAIWQAADQVMKFEQEKEGVQP